MQRQVSKRNLSILILSILLILSLGLTATMAAFSTTKTVSGTITFSGSVEIRFNGGQTPVAKSGVNANDPSLDSTVYTLHMIVDLDDGTVSLGDDAVSPVVTLTSIVMDGKGKAFNWQVRLVENNTVADTTQPGVAIDLKTGNAGKLQYSENPANAGYNGSEIVDGVEWSGQVTANNAGTSITITMAEILAAIDLPLTMANMANDANDEPKPQAVDLVLTISTGTIAAGTARV